jgi:ABC-type spermidine/putrescine transport system permease subunit II
VDGLGLVHEARRIQLVPPPLLPATHPHTALFTRLHWRATSSSALIAVVGTVASVIGTRWPAGVREAALPGATVFQLLLVRWWCRRRSACCRSSAAQAMGRWHAARRDDSVPVRHVQESSCCASALSIPDDLLDAARIDGASEYRIFFGIVLPVMQPILVTLASFSFLSAWNDFLWPLIVLSDSSRFTLPVALASLAGEHIQDAELMMAGAVLTVLPVIVIFLMLQRFYTEGVMRGSLKG